MEIKDFVQFAFNIDRGGTFTDFYVQEINGQSIISEEIFKTPSESFLGEGPIVGIKQFFCKRKLMNFEDKIPTKWIRHINLGTTIGTNALLERKGCENAMILTKGFPDLLFLRHQARPNIFDLKCERYPPLSKHTFQLNERVYLNPPSSDEKTYKTLTVKDKTLYVEPPSEHDVIAIAKHIQSLGINSVGISLCNSYLFPEHQNLVFQIFKSYGIHNLQKGSNYKDLGYLKRSETTSLDAFLNPISTDIFDSVKHYFQDLKEQFDQPDKLTLRLMKSEGGFGETSSVRASELLLSGPAGGLIGYSSEISTFEKISGLKIESKVFVNEGLIGLDMGGTSTDVSRLQDRKYTTKYSFEVQGIEICTPHLEIDTIAAGGGSKITFENGMFQVGPQSVGSNPGPVCYGIASSLALTDCNLLLNRLDSQFFPKIFGKTRDQGLNIERTRQQFEKLTEKINENIMKEKHKNIYEIAEGFIEIANELMAKSARKLLTFGKPDALIMFGSAGGQHSCDVGLKIGVHHIFIHKYSGILSAFGLSKAPEIQQHKTFLGIKVDQHQFNFSDLEVLINSKTSDQKSDKYDQVIRQVGMGYEGTAYNLLIPLNENLIQNFLSQHKKQNGFLLGVTTFRIEYIRNVLVKYPEQINKKEAKYEKEDERKYVLKEKEVFLEGKFEKISFYDINQMKNCSIEGPAMLLSGTSSVLVKRHWHAFISDQVTYLFYKKETNTQATFQQQPLSQERDPIKLTLYSTRLMSIAEEMGKILQKISISTNIRERLDFSCGIFDWNGKLLANAPHLPVHLGSMETAVTEQIKRNIQDGDVILTNHPMAGGSHLPDLTVVTCVRIDQHTRLFLASRGHHADIGGITPGSMPPFSKKLSEEGVAIEKFHLIENGQFQNEKVRQLFKESRRINDNVSDLLAQVAANQFGAKLLKKFINEYGIVEFKRYVGFICENACHSVENLLHNFSLRNNLQEIDFVQACEYMDDGTPLNLKLTIDRKSKKAIFDFTGTGNQVLGNTNAPKSITRSAILYCLRSLIGEQIPLNSGCLVPLEIIIPQNSILAPSKDAAVVGGNVETSQKLVDLILKPFKYVSCSQGTMNNFLFGNNQISYYETICGGSGAGNGFNGTTVQCHMTNTRITDIQSLEKDYPVIVRQFKQRQASGGNGKFHGGNGVIREFQFLQEVQVSILSERRVFSAYGLEGGENGKTGKNTYITKDHIEKNLGSKNSFKIQKFESVRIETPGGGGFGQILI